jgi:putative tryptophan/tyrosine transport system substrate-binding protein
MRRRDFIKVVGSVAAWPLDARAQQPIGRIPHLGVLLPGLPESYSVQAMRDRLRELGYTEGRNVILEFRWAEGNLERLTELAAELASLKVDAIITISTPAAIAARKATTTIPIIFAGVGDLVGAGVVPSLARPGGNATVFSLLATELSAKRLEILQEIAPNTSHVAVLWNDTNTGMVLRAREAQDAAAKLGLTIQSIGVHDLIDFDSAFAMIESGRTNALLALADPFTRQHRKRIVDFAAQRRLPAIYEVRKFVESGGLICYGPSLLVTERRVAEYVKRCETRRSSGRATNQVRDVDQHESGKDAESYDSAICNAARRSSDRVNWCGGPLRTHNLRAGFWRCPTGIARARR